jgi:hypothetical protein
MKKSFSLIAVLLLALAPLAAQTVTVTSPNGGESWPIGLANQITWNSTNAGSAVVNITLRNAAGKVGDIKIGVALSKGSWTWPSVGTLADGTVVEARGDYVVRISIVGMQTNDDSNAPFAITGTAPPSQPSINVTEPNGWWWRQHVQREITWNYANAGNATVNITLRQGKPGTYAGDIKTSVPLSAGRWMWNDVGKLENGTQVPDRVDYYVRVGIVGYPTYSDSGLVPITDEQSGPPSFWFVTPWPMDPEQNYAIGTNLKVACLTGGYQGTATLFLCRGGEKYLIAGGIPIQNEGVHYPWKVGQHQGGTAAAGSGYRFQIRVDDPTLGPFVFETTSEYFTLSIPQPAVVKEHLSDLRPFLTKSPRLQVTDIGLAPNLEGFGIIFSYKNAGEGPLPRASEVPVKPNYRVVIDGKTITSGSLFIPVFPAPPGWEQQGYFGGFIVMPATLGDFQFHTGNLIDVEINENKVMNMASNGLTRNLKDMLAKYCYDLELGEVGLNWDANAVSLSVWIGGKFPSDKDHIQVTVVGLRKPFSFQLSLKPGQTIYYITKHLEGCEIPKEQKSIGLKLFAELLPRESGNGRIMDRDLRNNVKQCLFVRPQR